MFILKARSARQFPVIPLQACLAKTWRNEARNLPGRTVEDHCRITGAVAELLTSLASMASLLDPLQAGLVAAVHDTGKLSPGFQHKIHEAAGTLELFPQLAAFNLSAVPNHAAVSRAALLDLSPVVAEIAGWHHGSMPEKLDSSQELCGGESWQSLRMELVSHLTRNRTLPHSLSGEQTALLKGLTAVADWIASGSLFDDPDQPWQALVSQAVEEAGFFPLSYVPDLEFFSLFGFAPNAIQKAMMQTVTGPGVYVLEAPMGTGKTEAALYAAYTLLREGKARGLYFALPTRLTSNRIYDRLFPFLHKILAPQSQSAAAMLLHSSAWLYATHEDQNDGGTKSSSWFEQSKRGLLAPFGAGTLDQALMSVINVRHAAVRSFGLAGKVVILDEIHTYDAYTGTLLDALVEHLQNLGCTVIMLSATLSRSRLSVILKSDQLCSESYPLLTFRRTGTEKTEENALVPEENICISLQMGVSEEKAIEEALYRAEQGQQVLWIENTVPDAQRVFRQLAALGSGLGVQTGLVHSRFTPSDRQKNEEIWTGLYGKNSSERAHCGRILVGTQVLEQSLDLDADFLLSRFCPTDMLLQRMGRLWRHKNTKRPAEAHREAWIMSPELKDALSSPSTSFGVSGLIYDPYVLARSLEVWHDRQTVELPSALRSLIEATYRDREEEPSAMLTARKLLREKNAAMRSLALFSQNKGQQIGDHAATTRLMDENIWPILLVRRLDREGCLLADGQEIVFPRNLPAPEQRRKISAALFSNIIHIRQKAPPYPRSMNQSAEKRRLFRDYLPVRENYEGIYLAKIRPDDTLEDLCSSGHVSGRYSAHLGWEGHSSF